MKPLTQELRRFIIHERLIGHYIFHLHKKGYGVGRIQNEITSWETIKNLNLEEHLEQELNNYYKWVKEKTHSHTPKSV